MTKTGRQMVLEAQHGKPIREVLLDALRRRQGQRNALTLVAADLQVTTNTLYRWFREFGIDVNDHRYVPSEASDDR